MAIKATALITLTRVNDGKGIKSTSVTYQIWSNGTSTPTGTWSSTPPKTTTDKPYLWTRTVITYSDNTQSTSYSVGSTPEGIQVGGRNLIRNSNFVLGTYLWSIGSDAKVQVLNDSEVGTYLHFTCEAGYSQLHGEEARIYPNGSENFTHKPGATYTLSLMAKSATGKALCSGVRGGNYSASFKLTTDWKRYTRTYTTQIEGSLSFFLLEAGEFDITDVKLELGNKATDWTPAPEDVDEAINTERTERQSAIETKANEITSKVSETYVSNSAFEHYQNTVSTQFTQTKKDFTWSINQSVTDAKNEMSGQIDSVNGKLDGLKQTTDNVNSYMSFDNDALTLGKSDSAFKTKITNQEWSIQKNGAKVTYINDKTMYITDGQFTQSLKIGAFGFAPKANGSLDFKKMG